MRRGFRIVLSAVVLPAVWHCPLLGLQAVRPANRVTTRIDDSRRVLLRGNVHPIARPQNDVGPVPAETPMRKMMLLLSPSRAQEQALTQLIAAQQNPRSPLYHQWLTPYMFANQFGVSEHDMEQVIGWLLRQGFTLDEIPASRRLIVFSGTAARVEQGLHASLRSYSVDGVRHISNATDPQIPAALASVVAGVVSLNDFPAQSLHMPPQRPQYTSGSTHYLAPADFAAIYDVNPLYRQAYNGQNESIAIIARTDIDLDDVRQFRSTFGLPANDPQIILNGPDPGITNSSDQAEATLDTEWAGAVAPNAKIDLVVSQSTNTADGTYLSAEYAINNDLAPILSFSYGLCEQDLGTTGNAFINELWQQAAAEGITVIVAAGDSGAAACDNSSAPSATGGRAVNGICSTPYNLCVGGTEFNDSNGSFWSATNALETSSSALGYVTETAWNQSGPGGLWSTGGGVSSVYPKPVWQSAAGVPADRMRDVPDVALSASSHDGYFTYIHGALLVSSGTSVAAPAFAGILAILTQASQTRVGVVNPAFYSLALQQPAVFHDITAGNNSVPGVTGYAAAIGYDQTTGLGSIDANALVAAWPGAMSQSSSVTVTTPPPGRRMPCAPDKNHLLVSCSVHAF